MKGTRSGASTTKRTKGTRRKSETRRRRRKTGSLHLPPPLHHQRRTRSAGNSKSKPRPSYRVLPFFSSNPAERHNSV
jgi:hypothetical protein